MDDDGIMVVCPAFIKKVYPGLLGKDVDLTVSTVNPKKRGWRKVSFRMKEGWHTVDCGGYNEIGLGLPTILHDRAHAMLRRMGYFKDGSINEDRDVFWIKLEESV